LCNYSRCYAYSKKTIEKIVEKGYYYIAQVKENNKNLLKWIKFNSTISKPIDTHTTIDNNTHGRYETRVCEVYDDLYQIDNNYKSVKRVIKVTSIVTIDNKSTTTIHYYISNLIVDAKKFLYIIRSHWKIENSLHYVKDVSFEEDTTRTRVKQIPLIQTIMRSLAINLGV